MSCAGECDENQGAVCICGHSGRFGALCRDSQAQLFGRKDEAWWEVGDGGDDSVYCKSSGGLLGNFSAFLCWWAEILSNNLQLAKPLLEPYFDLVHVPQTRPLSPGELLGCTSPRLPDDLHPDLVIYLGDGRFHLESMMIHNPELSYYKYDPYGRTITREFYDHGAMKSLRTNAIETAKAKGRSWGLILGTLGRQGNPNVYSHIKSQLDARGLPHTTILLSEISPAKLARFTDIDVFVQTSCPRLSIDWGHQYDKPLLSPYEASVVLGSAEWKERYPMDFYSKDSSGPWTPYFDPLTKEKEAAKLARKEARAVAGKA